ncbi:hypothetical protein SAMN02910298_01323 [Pseudobutyrivibrio sp. YE44]|uniref:hypothetical protein n=1 Tax=Pseudobutyrivibrio sp. YE44 TaxID=1520802 RepID=UPI00088BD13D|nr:hypothetical protein [Pseudobutyrivibrio sp. YE44]SDB26064.1 hypothetical protein SAMN02910298_01323 [Pseudobutyrivibrio sp. YE44]
MSEKTDLKIIAVLIIFIFVLLIGWGIISHRSIFTVDNDKFPKNWYIFWAYREDSDIKFHENGLLINLCYYNYFTGKDVSIEELEDVYLQENEMFRFSKNNELYDDYVDSIHRIHSEDLDNIEKAFNNLALKEKEESYFDLSFDDACSIRDIYLKQQELVSNYYSNDRIMLCNLTEEQQEEFYKLYKDSNYKIDDSIMKTNEPFSEYKHYEYEGLITEIKKDKVSINVFDGKKVISYSGTCRNIHVKEGDYVYFDFYLFTLGTETEWTGIEFEHIDKKKRPADFDEKNYK